MMHIDTIQSFTSLAQKSSDSDQPILCVLESRKGFCLVNEIAESYLQEYPDAFELINIAGSAAEAIQVELSILNLPSAILLVNGQITAMFERIMAKHDLFNALKN